MAGTFFSEQAESLTRVGHRVGVIYPDRRSLKTLHLGGIALGYSDGIEGSLVVHRHGAIAAPRMHAWNGRRWVTGAVRLFRRYVARQGVPDVVHAHSAIWAGVAASRIAGSDGIPFVLTEHSTGFARGLFEEWHRPFLTEALASARIVMAVSEALRRDLTMLGIRDDICVVPNSVDTALFRLPPRPRPRDLFRFVCIALLDEKKGVDVLLRAFALSFRGDPGVHLDIVGDGPEASRLRGLARELGLAERVAFHGARDRQGVRDILWSSHCCVSSSHVETFGVTLIESLATGIPVVATRSGGPEDIVTPDCGILTAVGNADELGDAMRSVYAGRERWAARSESLRTSAERRFGQQAVAERLTAIYHSAVGEN
jgi:glycosyltransferase involved in cell wall biosynthesis